MSTTISLSSAAAAPPVPLDLSPDQIAFFHENGFLSLPRLLSPDEVEWMRGVYDRLFDARAGREAGDQFDLGGADEDGKAAALPQILGPDRYAPELKTARFRDAALHIARQLLGPDAAPTGDHAILKPAGSGAPTPWHQDEAYWNPGLDYQSVSFWIPLQEATIENGCLYFLPGSHRWEILPHQSIGGDARVHGLELIENGIDLSGALACPLAAGGATIHLNRTLHYAGPNKTNAPRRAYIAGYGVPATPRSEPRRFPWNEKKQTARASRAKVAQNAATSG